MPEQLELDASGDLIDDAFDPSDASLAGDLENEGGVRADLGAEALGVAAEAALQPIAASQPRAASMPRATGLSRSTSLPGLSRIVISLRRCLVGVAKAVKVVKAVKAGPLSAVWRPTWEQVSFTASRGSNPYARRKFRRTGIS